MSAPLSPRANETIASSNNNTLPSLPNASITAVAPDWLSSLSQDIVILVNSTPWHVSGAHASNASLTRIYQQQPVITHEEAVQLITASTCGINSLFYLWLLRCSNSAQLGSALKHASDRDTLTVDDLARKMKLLKTNFENKLIAYKSKFYWYLHRDSSLSSSSIVSSVDPSDVSPPAPCCRSSGRLLRGAGTLDQDDASKLLPPGININNHNQLPSTQHMEDEIETMIQACEEWRNKLYIRQIESAAADEVKRDSEKLNANSNGNSTSVFPLPSFPFTTPITDTTYQFLLPILHSFTVQHRSFSTLPMLIDAIKLEIEQKYTLCLEVQRFANSKECVLFPPSSASSTSYAVHSSSASVSIRSGASAPPPAASHIPSVYFTIDDCYYLYDETQASTDLLRYILELNRQKQQLQQKASDEDKTQKFGKFAHSQSKANTSSNNQSNTESLYFSSITSLCCCIQSLHRHFNASLTSILRLLAPSSRMFTRPIIAQSLDALDVKKMVVEHGKYVEGYRTQQRKLRKNNTGGNVAKSDDKKSLVELAPVSNSSADCDTIISILENMKNEERKFNTFEEVVIAVKQKHIDMLEQEERDRRDLMHPLVSWLCDSSVNELLSGDAHAKLIATQSINTDTVYDMYQYAACQQNTLKHLKYMSFFAEAYEWKRSFSNLKDLAHALKQFNIQYEDEKLLCFNLLNSGTGQVFFFDRFHPSSSSTATGEVGVSPPSLSSLAALRAQHVLISSQEVEHILDQYLSHLINQKQDPHATPFIQAVSSSLFSSQSSSSHLLRMLWRLFLNGYKFINLQHLNTTLADYRKEYLSQYESLINFLSSPSQSSLFRESVTLDSSDIDRLISCAGNSLQHLCTYLHYLHKYHFQFNDIQELLKLIYHLHEDALKEQEEVMSYLNDSTQHRIFDTITSPFPFSSTLNSNSTASLSATTSLSSTLTSNISSSTSNNGTTIPSLSFTRLEVHDLFYCTGCNFDLMKYLLHLNLLRGGRNDRIADQHKYSLSVNAFTNDYDPILEELQKYPKPPITTTAQLFTTLQDMERKHSALRNEVFSILSSSECHLFERENVDSSSSDGSIVDVAPPFQLDLISVDTLIRQSACQDSIVASIRQFMMEERKFDSLTDLLISLRARQIEIIQHYNDGIKSIQKSLEQENAALFGISADSLPSSSISISERDAESIYEECGSSTVISLYIIRELNSQRKSFNSMQELMAAIREINTCINQEKLKVFQFLRSNQCHLLDVAVDRHVPSHTRTRSQLPLTQSSITMSDVAELFDRADSGLDTMLHIGHLHSQVKTSRFHTLHELASCIHQLHVEYKQRIKREMAPIVHFLTDLTQCSLWQHHHIPQSDMYYHNLHQLLLCGTNAKHPILGYREDSATLIHLIYFNAEYKKQLEREEKKRLHAEWKNTMRSIQSSKDTHTTLIDDETAASAQFPIIPSHYFHSFSHLHELFEVVTYLHHTTTSTLFNLLHPTPPSQSLLSHSDYQLYDIDSIFIHGNAQQYTVSVIKYMIYTKNYELTKKRASDAFSSMNQGENSKSCEAEAESQQVIDSLTFDDLPSLTHALNTTYLSLTAQRSELKGKLSDLLLLHYQDLFSNVDPVIPFELSENDLELLMNSCVLSSQQLDELSNTHKMAQHNQHKNLHNNKIQSYAAATLLAEKKSTPLSQLTDTSPDASSNSTFQFDTVHNLLNISYEILEHLNYYLSVHKQFVSVWDLYLTLQKRHIEYIQHKYAVHQYLTDHSMCHLLRPHSVDAAVATHTISSPSPAHRTRHSLPIKLDMFDIDRIFKESQCDPMCILSILWYFDSLPNLKYYFNNINSLILGIKYTYLEKLEQKKYDWDLLRTYLNSSECTLFSSNPDFILHEYEIGWLLNCDPSHMPASIDSNSASQNAFTPTLSALLHINKYGHGLEILFHLQTLNESDNKFNNTFPQLYKALIEQQIILKNVKKQIFLHLSNTSQMFEFSSQKPLHFTVQQIDKLFWVCGFSIVPLLIEQFEKEHRKFESLNDLMSAINNEKNTVCAWMLGPSCTLFSHKLHAHISSIDAARVLFEGKSAKQAIAFMQDIMRESMGDKYEHMTPLVLAVRKKYSEHKQMIQSIQTCLNASSSERTERNPAIPLKQYPVSSVEQLVSTCTAGSATLKHVETLCAQWKHNMEDGIPVLPSPPMDEIIIQVDKLHEIYLEQQRLARIKIIEYMTSSDIRDDLITGDNSSHPSSTLTLASSLSLSLTSLSSTLSSPPLPRSSRCSSHDAQVLLDCIPVPNGYTSNVSTVLSHIYYLNHDTSHSYMHIIPDLIRAIQDVNTKMEAIKLEMHEFLTSTKCQFWSISTVPTISAFDLQEIYEKSTCGLEILFYLWLLNVQEKAKFLSLDDLIVSLQQAKQSRSQSLEHIEKSKILSYLQSPTCHLLPPNTELSTVQLEQIVLVCSSGHNASNPKNILPEILMHFEYLESKGIECRNLSELLGVMKRHHDLKALKTKELFSYLTAPERTLFSNPKIRLTLTESRVDTIYTEGGAGVDTITYCQELEQQESSVDSVNTLILAIQTKHQTLMEKEKNILARLLRGDHVLTRDIQPPVTINRALAADIEAHLNPPIFNKNFNTVELIDNLILEKNSSKTPSFNSLPDLHDALHLQSIQLSKAEELKILTFLLSNDCSLMMDGDTIVIGLEDVKYLIHNSSAEKFTLFLLHYLNTYTIVKYKDIKELSAALKAEFQRFTDMKQSMFFYLTSKSCCLFNTAPVRPIITPMSVETIIEHTTDVHNNFYLYPYALDYIHSLDANKKQFANMRELINSLRQAHQLKLHQIRSHIQIIHSYLSSVSCQIFIDSTLVSTLRFKQFYWILKSINMNVYCCMKYLRELDEQATVSEHNAAPIRFKDFSSFLAELQRKHSLNQSDVYQYLTSSQSQLLASNLTITMSDMNRLPIHSGSMGHIKQFQVQGKKFESINELEAALTALQEELPYMKSAPNTIPLSFTGSTQISSDSSEPLTAALSAPTSAAALDDGSAHARDQLSNEDIQSVLHYLSRPDVQLLDAPGAAGVALSRKGLARLIDAGRTVSGGVLHHLQTLNASGRKFSSLAALAPVVQNQHVESVKLQLELLEFFSSHQCILFRDVHGGIDLNMSDMSRLLDEGGAGFHTLSYCTRFNQEQYSFLSLDELISAVQSAQRAQQLKEDKWLILNYLTGPSHLFSKADWVSVSNEGVTRLIQVAGSGHTCLMILKKLEANRKTYKDLDSLIADVKEGVINKVPIFITARHIPIPPDITGQSVCYAVLFAEDVTSKRFELVGVTPRVSILTPVDTQYIDFETPFFVEQHSHRDHSIKIAFYMSRVQHGQVQTQLTAAAVQAVKAQQEEQYLKSGSEERKVKGRLPSGSSQVHIVQNSADASAFSLARYREDEMELQGLSASAHDANSLLTTTNGLVGTSVFSLNSFVATSDSMALQLSQGSSVIDMPSLVLSHVKVHRKEHVSDAEQLEVLNYLQSPQSKLFSQAGWLNMRKEDIQQLIFDANGLHSCIEMLQQLDIAGARFTSMEQLKQEMALGQQSTIPIYLAATNLPNHSQRFPSYLVEIHLKAIRSGLFEFIGSTEMSSSLDGSTSPLFQNSILVPFYSRHDQDMSLQVFAIDSNEYGEQQKILIGDAFVSNGSFARNPENMEVSLVLEGQPVPHAALLLKHVQIQRVNVSEPELKAVLAFLSSPRDCHLFDGAGWLTLHIDTVTWLIQEGGGGTNTLKILMELDAQNKKFINFDALITAVAQIRQKQIVAQHIVSKTYYQQRQNPSLSKQHNASTSSLRSPVNTGANDSPRSPVLNPPRPMVVIARDVPSAVAPVRVSPSAHSTSPFAPRPPPAQSDMQPISLRARKNKLTSPRT